MRLIILKTERLYYVLFLLLFEPYFYFYRRKLAHSIWDDWFFKKTNWKSFQNKALQSTINSALNTEYYNRLQKEGVLTKNPTLLNFPIVSKVEMKNEVKGFINKNIFIPHSKFNTGGSTGEPFDFYNAYHSKQLEYAHQYFFYKRLGYKRGDVIASIDGVSIDEKSRLNNVFWKNKFINFPFGSLKLSATNLTNKNAIYYIEKLANEKPAFIRGYPSAISLISDVIIKNGLQYKFSFVKGIMLTSENIDERQIELAKKAFGCTILPQYGMTETCAFGFTNPNELKYYCSPYYGITEIIDKNGNHVEKGEIGEIILTSFGNLYQPFVRYRTGDLAEYGGETNGFVILNKIIGRAQDYLVDTDFQKIMLVGLIFGAHTHVFGAIKMWQIIQSKQGEIEIKIDPLDNWDKGCENELREVLNANNKIKINFIYTNNFELTKAGKRKFMVQKLIENDEK